jgi:serine/threonine protein kinase
MPLTPGTKLGPYEIQAPLGAGGMGEVYTARDTRLERTVAVKILPRHLSVNEQFKQRFDREAKVISGLSHPNICALFDVGNANGVDYLVMEYLEGETLFERLAKGALPPAETLRLGMQIADALAAAHRAGVVHRDLKPGNVMLTRTGVKLLDFGLAKAGGATDAADSVTAMHTAAGSGEPLTKEGSILGTFQYMAPEQLEGKEADARTDIFSLGAVLYEMATGAKAFEGESQASLIAKIMSQEPRPISDLQPMSPPAFEQLVKACLTKDPDERIQTAHDVKLQLRWIVEGSSAAGIPAPVSTRRRVRSRLAWALAGIFFLTTAALMMRVVASRETPPPVVRASLLPPPQGNFNLEIPNQAVAPDGSRIVFVAADSSGQDHLYLRSLTSLDAEMLQDTETAVLPFWAPDGRQVGFFVEGKLKRISVVGERRVQVVCDVKTGRGGAWNADGTILFCPASSGPLFRVPASGGQPVQVTAIDTTSGETAHRFPQFIGGDRFLYVAIPPGADGYAIRTATLSEPEPRTVLTAGGAATFAAPDHLLFWRDGTLFAQRFAADRGQVQGEPLPLPESPNGQTNYNGSPYVSASATGVLTFPQSSGAEYQFEWLDREGRSLGTVPVPAGDYTTPALSPRGDRLAAAMSAGRDTDIWIIELGRGLSSRLTFEPYNNGSPTWSLDGSRVYFSADVEGSRNIYWKLSNGAGRRELLIKLPGVFNGPQDISPDGETMVVRMLRKDTGEDLMLLSLDGDPEIRPYLDSRFNEMNGSISPDGRWLAYQSDESGQFEMYVQTFPVQTSKYRISPNGSGSLYSTYPQPVWGKEGRELVYVSGDGMTVVATALTPGENALDVGATKTLFRLPREHRGYSSLDGERFLACVPSRESATPTLTVVTNWMAGLTGP